MSIFHRSIHQRYEGLGALAMLLLFCCLPACNQGKPGAQQAVRDTPVVRNEAHYLKIMKARNFQLERTGPCDDADGDTVHAWAQVYLESRKVVEDKLVLQFRFIEACCQDFYGDYTVHGDTLKFILEDVVHDPCKCQCWYRYRLTVREPGLKNHVITIDNQE